LLKPTVENAWAHKISGKEEIPSTTPLLLIKNGLTGCIWTESNNFKFKSFSGIE